MIFFRFSVGETEEGEVLRKYGIFSVLVLAGIVLSGCVTTAKVNSDQPYRVSKVIVTKSISDVGTINLAEDVRVKTMKESAKISARGQPKVVKISLNHFHAKNPALSLLIGDANSMSASVTVVDGKTGKQDASFRVAVTDSGYLQGVSGAVLAGLDNPVDVEQRMATLMAKDVALNIFGPKYAHGGGATVSVKARYPRSYAALKRERECKYKKEMAARDPDNDDVPRAPVKVPAYCKA